VDKYSAAFTADRISNLITRLHHNVIRTGLHRINLAYSRISLKVGRTAGVRGSAGGECVGGGECQLPWGPRPPQPITTII
jgi:hypothetical protein